MRGSLIPACHSKARFQFCFPLSLPPFTRHFSSFYPVLCSCCHSRCTVIRQGWWCLLCVSVRYAARWQVKQEAALARLLRHCLLHPGITLFALLLRIYMRTHIAKTHAWAKDTHMACVFNITQRLLLSSMRSLSLYSKFNGNATC